LGKLYPKQWRERYGKEVEDLSKELLAAGEVTRRHLLLELVSSGLAERVRSLNRVRLVVVSGAVALLAIIGLALSLGGVFRGRPSASPPPTCRIVGHPLATFAWREPLPTSRVTFTLTKLVPLPGSDTLGQMKVTWIKRVPPPRFMVTAGSAMVVVSCTGRVDRGTLYIHG
jgi:hypothetical protein